MKVDENKTRPEFSTDRNEEILHEIAYTPRLIMHFNGNKLEVQCLLSQIAAYVKENYTTLLPVTELYICILHAHMLINIKWIIVSRNSENIKKIIIMYVGTYRGISYFLVFLSLIFSSLRRLLLKPSPPWTYSYTLCQFPSQQNFTLYVLRIQLPTRNTIVKLVYWPITLSNTLYLL